jgi:hypothetical protein
MNSKTTGKWQVRVAVLLLFVVGFISGALATNIYRDKHWSSRSSARGGLEQMLDKLDLSPDQRAQVNVIIEDVRKQMNELRKESEPRFREVRRNAEERLKVVMDPQQWERFHKMIDKRIGPYGQPINSQ